MLPRNDAAAASDVVFLDGLFDVAERQPEAFELGLVERDGVLLFITAEVGDLGHARHAPEPLRDDPVVERAQLNEIEGAIRYQLVAINLAIRRGIGPQARRDAIGQDDIAEFFHDALSGPVAFRAFFECHLHHG